MQTQGDHDAGAGGPRPGAVMQTQDRAGRPVQLRVQLVPRIQDVDRFAQREHDRPVHLRVQRTRRRESVRGLAQCKHVRPAGLVYHRVQRVRRRKLAHGTLDDLDLIV